MSQYQYIRDDGHTMVRLTEDGEKVKVSFGEIVESDRGDAYFTSNGFQKYPNNAHPDDIYPEAKIKKAKNEPKSDENEPDYTEPAPTTKDAVEAQPNEPQEVPAEKAPAKTVGKPFAKGKKSK